MTGMISIPSVAGEPQSGNVRPKAISHLHTFFLKYQGMALSNSFHIKSHVTAKLNSLTEHQRPFAKTKASASLHNPR